MPLTPLILWLLFFLPTRGVVVEMEVRRGVGAGLVFLGHQQPNSRAQLPNSQANMDSNLHGAPYLLSHSLTSSTHD